MGFNHNDEEDEAEQWSDKCEENEGIKINSLIYCYDAIPISLTSIRRNLSSYGTCGFNHIIMLIVEEEDEGEQWSDKCEENDGIQKIQFSSITSHGRCECSKVYSRTFV